MTPFPVHLQRPDAAAARPPPDLAEVIHHRRGSVVRLPPDFSRAAVTELLRVEGLTGSVVMGPADIAGAGSIAPEQWAIIAECGHLRFLPEKAPIFFNAGAETKAVFVFPKHTLVVPNEQARWVLWALESVKPEKLDADGRPLPWTTAVPPPANASPEVGRADDARIDDGVLPPEAIPAGEDGAGSVISTAKIHEWFDPLCAAARFSGVILNVRRGGTDKRGFVSGTVTMSSSFVPRRIVITTCPNADEAEIVATLAHELAHPLSRSCEHGTAFCQALLDLVARVWGEAYFAEARRQSAAPVAVIGRWVASGIRAALAGREPPARRVCDDGHAARIVSKVAKLWALAADQMGKPEAIGATAAANDLITTHGLDPSQIGAAPSLGDHLTDRWVLLEPRQPWQRLLAHRVARFNGVYSLSMDSKARMHFFGRYSDVVAAEYLCTISIERIKRECTAHIEASRKRGDLPKGGARRVAAAFCDSAVREFGRKLSRIADEESRNRQAPSEQHVALEEARLFASQQLEMRGLRVHTLRGREVRHSEEGAAVGRSMQVVRGLDSQGEPPRRLNGRV